MRSIRKRKYCLKEILAEWLETKGDIKIQSYQKYQNIIKKYLVDVNHLSIDTSIGKKLEKFMGQLKEKNVSTSIQKTIIYVLKSAINLGIQKQYYIPIDLSTLKVRKQQKIIHILSKEEQLQLEYQLKSNLNIKKTCLLLCLYTGLRKGEVCGLKWEDIDFEHQYLQVKRTIQRINNPNGIHPKTILIESTPKSVTSNRIVPIPSFLIENLKKYQSKNDYYLLSNSEKLYDPRQLTFYYQHMIEKSGIKYINFHTLRHTFATRSIESQMDIKTLSEILGHSSIDITLKLYVHPSYELKKNSIEKLVQFMNVT